MLRRHFIINTESSIPNNEIWYTSSDGNIVTPSNTNSLPTIDSNTYNGGKGVIKFKTDVTSIGAYAFFTKSRFRAIVIPNSVTSIGSSVFESCSSLTSISYNGTISQWNTITKDISWNKNVPATVVHCTDGDVEI